MLAREAGLEVPTAPPPEASEPAELRRLLRPGGLIPTIMITGNEGSRHRAYAEMLGELA